MIFYCILLRRLSATRVVPAAATTPATELASPVLGRTRFSRLGAGCWDASEAGAIGAGAGCGSGSGSGSGAGSGSGFGAQRGAKK